MYLPRAAYQAQGGFFDCESFEPQIVTLKEVARGIETAKIEDQITTAKGQEMLLLALKMGSELTDKALEMIQKLTNLAVTNEIGLAASSVSDSFQKNIGPLLFSTTQAKREGRALISSFGFQRAIAAHMRATVRGFETLAFLEDIKPGILCALGKVLTIASKIGAVFVSIGEVISAPFEAAIEAAGDLGKAADIGLEITKWLTIGGGLFLLYWYGLIKK